MINSSFTTAIYYTIAILNFSVKGVGIANAIAKKDHNQFLTLVVVIAVSVA